VRRQSVSSGPTSIADATYREVTSLPFRSEHEMTDPAEAWLGSQGLMTDREFATPWGICDLVGCTIDREHAARRIALGQTGTLSSPLAAAILRKIPDAETCRSIRPRTLLARLGPGHGEDAVAKQIENLTRKRFAQTTSRGTLQRLNGWMPLRRRIVALELKIDRVGDALHQATNNFGFADESYVGLPMRIAERLVGSQSAKKFRRARVGILGVGRRHCKVLLDSGSWNSARNPVLEMCFTDRFWRRYLETVKH